ncbi:MAG: hypothetical protein AAF250_04385 [Pseudomonadota bacterium]
MTWLLVIELPTVFYQISADPGFKRTDVDPFLASTDLVAAIIFIAIALYANRAYPLWIAGMQLLALTAHVARGLAETVSPVAYTTMVIAPGWLQLLFLGCGLGFHLLRQRRYGNYRDWRISRGMAEWSMRRTKRSNGSATLASSLRTRKDGQ